MKRYYLCLFSFFIMTATQCQDSATIKTKKHSPYYAVLRTMDGHLSRGWLYQANINEISLIEKKMVIIPLVGIVYRNTETTGLPTRFLTEQIDELALRKKNAGMYGALIGLGIGAATGAMIGFASGDDPVSNWFYFTAREKATLYALGLGSIGMLTGVIIGTVAKKKFIIGGKKEKMEEQHQLIMQRAMIQ